MKRFGIFSAIVMAFYSDELYRDVARHWKGVGAVYLLVLLALCWLPSAARGFMGLHRFAVEQVPRVVDQLPVVKITDGVMQATPPGRHVIRDPQSTGSRDASALVIIDDTVDEAPSDLEIPAIVVTRHEFAIIQPRRSERRVYSFSRQTNMTITPDRVRSFLSSLQLWVPTLGYLLAVIGSFAFRMAQAMVYGAVAQMFARRSSATPNSGLEYRTAIRLAAIAVTPVIVVRTFLWFGPWEPAWYFRWPVAILVTLFYLNFAARAAMADLAESPPGAVSI